MAPSCVCKGKMKESRDLKEAKDDEPFLRDSFSIGNFVRISDLRCSRAGKYATTGQAAARGIAGEDERFKDNPLGIGCWRYFCGGPTSNVPHRKQKPLAKIAETFGSPEDDQMPKDYLAGSGHNGLCDTPGMKILKGGVNAIQKIWRRMTVSNKPGTDLIKPCFRHIKSWFGTSEGKETERPKPELAEKADMSPAIKAKSTLPSRMRSSVPPHIEMPGALKHLAESST